MKHTADIKFLELCEEIDFWKEQARYYKKEYEQQLQERSIESKQNLVDAQEGVANALRFALAVEDGENGELIINKENRILLGHHWETTKIKENFYDDGILRNMDVGDWVVTTTGEVVRIEHDDMDDLLGENITRFATAYEIKLKKDGK